MLTESELQLIRDEFRETILLENAKYNKLSSTGAHPIDLKFAQQAAEACAKIFTKEREKTKEIVAAAKGMLDYDVNTIIKIASKSHLLTITVESSKVIKFINALTNYQNKTP